ncbi:hypothetical protein [Pseudomonas syringae]|uniref:hypothetical protein n=1 Tax=Pseudomonas syringae TaxID=317 RepID=UPI00200A1566|nr:hypothetical protein [Pseudomonas syringae]MCK9709882.1 hypothetical protein [Pseudomonas syringae pv. syringae]
MGIPVIDVSASYSFAHLHPYLTALMVLVLLGMAYCMYRFFRLSLYGAKGSKKLVLPLSMFALYLAVTVPILMAWFAPQPSWLQRLEAATQQVMNSQIR